MLPIGTAVRKTLHPPSSTLHAKETTFGKAHAHVFKDTQRYKIPQLFWDAFVLYNYGFHSDYSIL